MNLLEFEAQYRNAIDETLNELQTAVLLMAQLQARIINVGQDLQNLSQTVEEFVTEQTLDTDSELVSSDQTNQSQLTKSSQLETSSLTPNSNWPSPVVYPLRPAKGRKSLAAIELPTFRGVRGSQPRAEVSFVEETDQVKSPADARLELYTDFCLLSAP